MARATRSRQALVSVNPETESKRNTRKTSSEKIKVGRVTKKNLNAKNVSDENSSSPIKNGKVSKNTRPQASVVRSKLHASRKGGSPHSDTMMAMKSPVLRDRTNTTNELVKIDSSAKKTEEVNSGDKTKSIRSTRSSKTTKSNPKQSSEVQLSIEKFVVRKQEVQNKNTKEKSAEKSKEVAVNKKHTIGSTFSKIISQKNSGTSKEKKSEKNAELSNSESNGKNQEVLSNKNVQSQHESPIANRVLRKRNISIEAVEQLLNEDDETPFESDEKHSRNCSKVDKIVNNIAAEAGEENKKINKFFKNKGVEEEVKTVPIVKKTLHGKINKRKNNEAEDSSFSVTLEDQRQSTKPPEKKLRPRANKNYCEVSKLSQDSNSNEDKLTNTEKVNDTDKGLKKIPIYKTVKLSEENVKDKDEIYNYLDDSKDDSEKKGKKRKKTLKKPIVKRVKKAATLKTAMNQKVKRKMTNKIHCNVQFEKQNKGPINIKQNIVANNIQTNIIVPEFPVNFSNAEDNNNHNNIVLPESPKQIIPDHLLNAGNSTIAEASTIKIISDKKLEGSKRISLTSTPPVPKTITSELKLFGPRNAITLKPTTKYSNMVNHSLIRQPMSPIAKVIENFDTGSPWRAVDAFSRVNQMVQSTPQINRLPSMREKKLPTHLSKLNKLNNLKSINSQDTIHISSIMEDKSSIKNEKSVSVPTINQNEIASRKPALLSNLNKKSINSQDTIHISSMMEDSLTDKNEKSLSMTTANQNEVSPRKFGTVISNLSPVKSANRSNSPVQNNVPTAQTGLSPIPSSDVPVDQEGLTIPTIHNKENTLTSPTKSPRKKISTPSPFRFDRIRTSKRLASIESQNKTPKSTPQKISKENEPEVGPSCLDKSKSTVLRQSNLHNYLNLDEMPESTRISTAHGIFDDVHSTPITGKKSKYPAEEPNIDNAFGFDDCDISETTPTKNKSCGSVIATEQDVRNSVKGKLFPKARVKSMMPSRISANTVKKILLKNVLEKKTPEKQQPEVFNNSDESDSEKKNETTKKDVENNHECQKSAKEVVLDAVSFSDTFDILSENGDIESKVPEQIPLFVDLEPVHFTQPPRRSYNKRKRAIYFNTSKEDSESDEEEDEKPKSKKKKLSKLNKEENKRMHEWLKNINKTFEEIEHYDLVVE